MICQFVVYDILQVLVPLCYLCKCYVILGYVNVSLVQHFVVLTGMFVESAFNFLNILLFYLEYLWKPIILLLLKFKPVTGMIMCMSLHLFCLSLVYTY
jgi:hypothetical protein